MLIDLQPLREKYDENLFDILLDAKRNYVDPKLAIVTINSDTGTESYIKSIKKIAEVFQTEVITYNASDVKEYEKIITSIKDVDGILPDPIHQVTSNIMNMIPAHYDVDRLSETDILVTYFGYFGDSLPCTVQAIMDIISFKNITLSGKHVVVIGRSWNLGRILSMALINKDATVTVCHSHTENLAEICKQADIIISTAGVPRLVTKDFVSPKTKLVIDVGVSMYEGKITGDVDPEVQYYTNMTPTPNGVGTITTRILLKRVLENAYSRREEEAKKRLFKNPFKRKE